MKVFQLEAFLPDKFALERYLYNNQCLDTCPETFYHTKEKRCEPCSDHCRLCTSPVRCLKCNSSYYVSDGMCAKLECGEGKQGHSVMHELLLFHLYLLSCIVSQFQKWYWKPLCHTCPPTTFPPSFSDCFSKLSLSFFSGEVEDPDYDDCMACEEGCRKCVLCKSQLHSHK